MANHLNKLPSFRGCCVPSLVDIGLVWKFVNIFLIFLYCLPLKKSVVIHSNKLESPSLTDLKFGGNLPSCSEKEDL